MTNQQKASYTLGTLGALGGRMITKWHWLPAVIGLVLYVACTLDNPDPPDLAGPSVLGTSIEMRAVPDQLVSDGFSSSIIEAVVRDANAQRSQGRTINFDITTFGAPGFLDLGNLAPVNGARPVAGGVESGPVSAVSDSSGVARVRYWAPFRTDQENDTTVNITGREASTDFSNQLLRSVTIFLRAANRPSFPGDGACSFIIEPRDDAYAVGDQIFFTATQITGSAGRPIARYEWDFGDGSPRVEGRNVSNVYSSAGDIGATTPGAYTVTLFTTESVSGNQISCTNDVVVTIDGDPPVIPPTPTVPPACVTPAATFEASQICDTGQVLADGAAVSIFDGSGSTAGTGETISAFAWTMGNGTTMTGQVVSITYPASLAGLEIAVVLEVTNSCGATATASETFDVVAVCP